MTKRPQPRAREQNETLKKTDAKIAELDKARRAAPSHVKVMPRHDFDNANDVEAKARSRFSPRSVRGVVEGRTRRIRRNENRLLKICGRMWKRLRRFPYLQTTM